MPTLRCEIFPDDLDATVAFYVTVMRFQLMRDERGSDVPYVALENGHVRLGAAHRSDVFYVASRRPPTGVELVLEVDDVDETFSHVQSCGWPIDGVQAVSSQPWGLRDFRLLDPSGYYWRISSR